MIVFRPIMAVGGQDLGFLPGSEEEKMGPWAAAVYDALRAITLGAARCLGLDDEIGSIACAPPNTTANMSSVMDPSSG